MCLCVGHISFGKCRKRWLQTSFKIFMLNVKDRRKGWVTYPMQLALRFHLRCYPYDIIHTTHGINAKLYSTLGWIHYSSELCFQYSFFISYYPWKLKVFTHGRMRGFKDYSWTKFLITENASLSIYNRNYLGWLECPRFSLCFFSDHHDRSFPPCPP